MFSFWQKVLTNNTQETKKDPKLVAINRLQFTRDVNLGVK